METPETDTKSTSKRTDTRLKRETQTRPVRVKAEDTKTEDTCPETEPESESESEPESEASIESSDEYKSEDEEEEEEEEDDEEGVVSETASDDDNDDDARPLKKSKYFINDQDDSESERVSSIPHSDQPYIDTSLHPNSLSFIQMLEENNNREWFKAHDKEYKRAKQNWDSFILALAAKVHANDPEHVPADTPLVRLQFRIHRDMRFSNGLPYKPRWCGGFSRTGCKGPFPKYFLVVWPKSLVVGAGYSALGDADVGPRALKALKDEIVETGGECVAKVLRKVQKKSSGLIFESSFDDAEGLMKEFLAMNVTDSMYKKVPKGFPADSPQSELLKLRSFVIKKQLDLDVVMEKDGALIVASYMKFLASWVKFVSKYFGNVSQ